MENQKEKVMTMNPKDLELLNLNNQNYYSPYGTDLNKESIKKDFEILLQYSVQYAKNLKDKYPSIGDCLILPDGQVVYFCMVHEYRNSVQTCAGGSFCLTSSGYLSYSGGLDCGIGIDEIELTMDINILPIWFAHNGYLKANCRVNAHIPSRVWKTKENADLSGIPQVQRLRRAKLKELSEKIKCVDGNGREYLTHLPEIIIYKQGVSESLIQEIEALTNLTFENSMYFNAVFWCQPMESKQIEILKEIKQLSWKVEHNCISHESMLVFQVNN